MKLTPEQEFLVKLEMERTDRSYLGKPKTVEPRVVYVTKKVYPKSRVERDALMFDAGRFAAGARDTAAVLAYKKVKREHYETAD